MGNSGTTVDLCKLNEELRPLHKREVLWALSIILGLTLAPAVGDIYATYWM